jgi:hypothetical protein
MRAVLECIGYVAGVAVLVSLVSGATTLAIMKAAGL